MKRLILAAAVALAVLPKSEAADLPVKAAPKLPVLQSYLGSGFYFGVHTFAQGTDVGAASPAAGTAATSFATGGAVGVTAGWMHGSGNIWEAVEVMASYKNVTNTTLTTTGVVTGTDSKYSFTQRAKIGGDRITSLLNWLPDLGLGGLFPTLPAPAPGTIGTTHPYAFGAIHEDDISASIGVATGKAWRVKGGLGVGIMSQIAKPGGNLPITADVWAEFIPADAGITVGAPVGRVTSGNEWRGGISLLF